MIVSTRKSSVAPKTYRIGHGKGAYIGPIYEGFKQTARIFGYYKDIEPYIPENILGKYKYKTHKRVFGYASQKLHQKKIFRNASYYKYNKECSRHYTKYWYNSTSDRHCYR